mmetsp:Transcript_102029/g.160955  ORF Transcript_102029/g.160955 Transcript_102029/m.160955 type:complete len:221 (+) Transcript_102029:76-738(+)
MAVTAGGLDALRCFMHKSESGSEFEVVWEEDGKLFEYPPVLCVRNTFVDHHHRRSPSLDEFLVDRKVRSWPSSGVDIDSVTVDEDIMGRVRSTSASSAQQLSSDDSAFEKANAADQALSKGSELHELGRCRPCVFFHTKGCKSGVDCRFCHICPCGEKMRRKKEKTKHRKFMRAQQRSAAICRQYADCVYIELPCSAHTWMHSGCTICADAPAFHADQSV